MLALHVYKAAKVGAMPCLSLLADTICMSLISIFQQDISLTAICMFAFDVLMLLTV